MVNQTQHSGRATELPGWARPWFTPARYKDAHGGRGSTKSWTVARLLIEIAARVSIRWICAREIQKSIRESVHKLLSDQITNLGYDHLFVVTDRTIRGRNGSEFIFEGLWQNIKNIKSLEGADGVWVEEAEAVSKNSWDVLIPTVRKPSKALADFYRMAGLEVGETVDPEIWVTFNPDDENDPTSEMFITKPIAGAVICEVNYDKNPWFAGSVLEREMLRAFEVDPDQAEHIWLGKFRRNKRAQIFAGKYELRDFEPGNDWSGPVYGMDFGFANDPLSCHEYWLGPAGGALQNTVFVYRELYKIGVESRDIERELKTAIPRLGKKKIVADCSRPETISDLNIRGLNVVPSKKWPGCVEDGISYLKSLDKIVIHKTNCPGAQTEARYYSYKVDKKTGLVLNAIKDSFNHFWDDMRYALQDAILTEEEEVMYTHQSPIMQTGVDTDLEAFDREMDKMPSFGAI